MFGARHGEDECFLSTGGEQSCDGTGEHGSSADFLIGEHAEDLAEAVKFFVDHAGDDFNGGVASCDAGSAGRKDGVNLFALPLGVEPSKELIFDIVSIVFDNGVFSGVMASILEE